MSTSRSLKNPLFEAFSYSLFLFLYCRRRRFVFSHYFFIQTLLKHSSLREFRSTTTLRCIATRCSFNSLLSNDAAPRSETSKFLFPGRNVEQNASCQMEDPHARHPRRKSSLRRLEDAHRWMLGRSLESFFWVTGARIVRKVTPRVPTCVCSVISNALARNTHGASAERKAEVSFPFCGSACAKRARCNERPICAYKRKRAEVIEVPKGSSTRRSTRDHATLLLLTASGTRRRHGL